MCIRDRTKTDRVGYVAANPVYGIPAAVNAYAQGLKTCLLYTSRCV